MLTPSKYWRIACEVDAPLHSPPAEFSLPTNLKEMSAPPAPGDGLILAGYEESNQTGFVHYLGIIERKNAESLIVNWSPTSVKIWVDSPAGRGNWKNKEGFGFAPKKVTGYGLHELFGEAFHLEVREATAGGARVASPTKERRSTSSVSADRLNPVEVIGTSNSSLNGGWVYVLKSAYGFKVGRTRNIPNRMRTFGVHLPFFYSIPFCAWFDDHVQAEKTYHQIFAEKRINGEWFDLDPIDVDLIRSGRFM